MPDPGDGPLSGPGASSLPQEAARLIEAGRYAEAEVALRATLARQPGDVQALDKLGLCLYLQGRFDDSVAVFRRALDAGGGRASAWYNLGTALSDLGCAADAVDAYRKCLAIDPDNESARYNLSRSLLLLGVWDEGWRLYEARGRKKAPTYVKLGFQRWLGEPPGGYVLVLSTEQGLGDAIQFARFVPHLRKSGYDILLMTAPVLAPLMQRVTGMGPVTVTAEAVKRVDGPPPRWAPLMSVPAAIGLRENGIPTAPYIAPDPAAVANWAARIGTHGFRIGVVWQGNPGHSHDRTRSIPLAAFAPLAAIDGVRLISLQKMPGADQVHGAPFGGRVETFLDPSDVSSRALLDMAAVMMNLDLVVTVDTMAAHLAGALGRPVWLALEQAPDWRWLLDRADSPWYPATRLFRQAKAGDWAPVIESMAGALQDQLGIIGRRP